MSIRILSRFLSFFSSGAFLCLLAGCGLLLFSWPLLTILDSGGPSGQFFGLYGVWAVLIVGGFVWANSGRGGDGNDGQNAEDDVLTCDWPPRGEKPE